MVNGRQIAAARVWLGISQSELGLDASVATRTIAHLEKGGRVLHNRTLEALVKSLQEMGVEFLEDEKDPKIGVGIRVREARISQAILDARTIGDKRGRKPRISKQRDD
ncbi:helix-turn-helix domain-containing protein [Bradyrhizobium sp. AZCC 1699]|uniref:helix-turn-helix domain-containing protein n=1 Tax=unclassified Bradyrhizobium TaxID=2631580 RepID=UPI0030300A42